MRNPRHAFILIGFIAQAMTWDSPVFIFLPVFLWTIAVTFLRNRLHISLTAEGLVLAAGCLISIAVNKSLHRTAHFFLGDGLILLQLVRLARPLSKREKLTSLIIACFHFGVLCTLAPDIRFILLFGAVVFLFPKALKEVLLAGDDPAGPEAAPLHFPAGYTRSFGLSSGIYLGVFAAAAATFLTFPRFTGSPLQLREGLLDQGSLLDSILDPRRSGRANSQQVLMQLEGDNIGYLRCFSLTEFDGVRWMADTKSRLIRMHFIEDDRELAKHNKRTVYVKNSHYLGRILPADGQVVCVRGNFFSRPFLSTHHSLECNYMWTTGNNVYEYWIDSDPKPESMSGPMRRHLLWHPEQSQRLIKWVQDQTSGLTNALTKARHLERYLRSNFQYELGTPELDRISPVDDFIFNRKEGHCERFAASLALLLRMQGIPSRVVIGYAATSRNLFSGRLQVRFRDAHAWTEGYIDGTGWVSFDATPGPSAAGVGSELADFLDALEFAWYSHVVNFNGFAQKQLFNRGLEIAARIPQSVWKNTVWVLLPVLFTIILFKLKNAFNFRQWFFRRQGVTFAKHSYGQMLAAYHRAGIDKPPHETPLEFLEQLRKRGLPGYTEAAVVTHAFCQTAYGGKTLSPESREQVEAALRLLQHTLPRKENGSDQTIERSGARREL